MKIKTVLCCWLSFLPFFLMGQELSVNASLQPAQIQIGEQARLHFELAQGEQTQVSCPLLTDTISKGLVIVEALPTDTISLGSGRLQINQDYLITSYDSGFYFVPAYEYASLTEKVNTRPLGLTVTGVRVNPETDDVKEIKTIMDAPFSWQEWGRWIGIALAILLGLALIIFILMKYVFKKKVSILPTKTEPVIPPHIVALGELERIQNEKIWQDGKIKEFYTQLTDVIRVYIQNSFGISAMEMTSDEIMALVKKHPEFEEVRQQLSQMLNLSDLVKFAKFIPLENENSQSLLQAFAVVDKTKPVEPVAEQDNTESAPASSTSPATTASTEKVTTAAPQTGKEVNHD